ncbi:PREDICTED: interferon-induced protein 44-like [Cyprinodon variegatus]|uniref:interferon-induced protein 44-like n=1 Tax=Cyprinodon variegatus TaxID=28743 RepID=UPI000742C69E|nr:PREDICTED: interferon-induced protein 44-like [Cyprinodon variegatus]
MSASTLLDKPWRELHWEQRQEDLDYVQEYRPLKEDIKHLRVLLYGHVGAGKSSFINSVSNVLRGRMTIPALTSAMTSDRSFTIKYATHKFSKGRGSSKTFYPVVFNDIMGLEDGNNSGIHPDDIKLALKGHVKEGHKFNPAGKLEDGDFGYNPSPSTDDKVHVLACVLSANTPQINASVLQKMKKVRETASELGIPQIGLMTHIDSACGEIEKDLKNVYRSKHLQKKIKDFSSAVGLPLNCIFPIKNYSDEIDMKEDVDTLILSALRKIIDFGDDFIEKC